MGKRTKKLQNGAHNPNFKNKKNHQDPFITISVPLRGMEYGLTNDNLLFIQLKEFLLIYFKTDSMSSWITNVEVSKHLNGP